MSPNVTKYVTKCLPETDLKQFWEQFVSYEMLAASWNLKENHVCQSALTIAGACIYTYTHTHSHIITYIYKQARKSSEDTHFTGYAGFEKVWARYALSQKSFRKIHFQKIHFWKIHFWKIRFRKIHFQKIHFRKIHFRKIHFRNILFRKIHKNNWGPLSSTFHVERPGTQTDWKSESITYLRTDGRTDIHG